MWKPYAGGGGGPNAAGSGNANGGICAGAEERGAGSVEVLGWAGLGVGPVFGEGFAFESFESPGF